MGQQQTSSLPISFTAVDNTIISTVEDAQIAAAQWNGKELIDVPEDITLELAIEIWQIFLEHAAGDVIDKAPSLSVKVGQQIILREKIKAASMKLQSKKAAIEVLESHIKCTEGDRDACDRLLQNLRGQRQHL